MTTEFYPNGAIVEGDYVPLDDLPEAEAPDVEITPDLVEAVAQEAEEATRLAAVTRIKQLLGEAENWRQLADQPRVHSATRDVRRGEARMLSNEADALIALKLLGGINPNDKNNVAKIALVRQKLRKEALAEQAAEMEAKRAAAIARDAAYGAFDGGLTKEPDAKERAANDKDF